MADDRPVSVPECVICPEGTILTAAAAEDIQVRSGGVFEAVQCPVGRGWHLRVVRPRVGR